MKIDYQKLEKEIKVNFKNKDLLIKSLTHKSFNKENNNEIATLLVKVICTTLVQN